jgi:hypothetical protein
MNTHFLSSYRSDYVQELIEAGRRGYVDLYRALIDEQLTAGNHEKDDRAQIFSSQVSKTKYRHGLK